MFTAGAGYYIYSLIDKISTPGGESISKHKVDEDYMLNFLVMGLDNDTEREKTGLEGTRSDSLMLVSVNTQTEKIITYSIPRDTLTQIYNDKNEFISNNGINASKINSSYEHGGENAVINTVEKLFPGVAIDYFATFNFLSFKGLVDAIGGIDVNVPVDIYDWKLEKVLVRAGQQTLNGTQALDVARARYQDSDFERGYRQQLIMKAIVDKSLDSISVNKAISILQNISDNVTTDLSIKDITSLFTVATSKNFSFEKIENIAGSFNVQGESMVYISSNTRKEVVTTINNNVNRDNSRVDEIDSEFIENKLQRSLNQIQYDVEINGYNDFYYDYINNLF